MAYNFANRRPVDLEAGGTGRSSLAENAIEGGYGRSRYSVPLVAHDSQADVSSSSQLNTTTESMSQAPSEYTVASNVSAAYPQNGLLGDVALSNEQMEAVLTGSTTEPLHDQAKATLGYEWGGFLLLLAIILTTGPEAGVDMHELCGIDPREEIINFVGWILAPVALSRAVVYISYRQPQHHGTFVSFSFALGFYWHATFGFWTLENFFRMVQAPPACGKAPISIVKLVYHVVLIIGAFPAIVFILGAVVLTCLVPYALYERFQKTQLQRQNQRRSTAMLQEMFRIKWSPQVLTYQDECCICLGEFQAKQPVVALPCDIKHYFHAGCIENWFKYHRACPYCKTEVTLEAIRKTKPSYEQQIRDAEAENARLAAKP